jgi:hypothetical protein
MFIRYDVVNTLSKDVYCTVSSLEEAQQVIEMERLNHPHWELIAVETKTPSVTGMGRDPDLH